MLDFDDAGQLMVLSLVWVVAICLLCEPDLVSLMVDDYIVDTVELSSVVVIQNDLSSSRWRIGEYESGGSVEVTLTAIQHLVLPITGYRFTSAM